MGELLLSQTLPVQREGYVANVEFFTLALYSLNLASNVQRFSAAPAFPRQCVLAWPGWSQTPGLNYGHSPPLGGGTMHAHFCTL